MPASAAAASSSSHLPEALISRLTTAGDAEAQLKALRELKNQIIGNRTKKLSYIKLGAVPAVVATLSAEQNTAFLVQSAAALGSFACGVDAGVKAVIDAGAFPHLLRLISHPDPKVVDACARSLRMIYQSRLSPKYDFLLQKNCDFVIALLDSENENLVGLGLSIISHSCETNAEQKALCDDAVLKKLLRLLEGSLNQRDATLESIATILKNNVEIVSKFVESDNGKALNAITELTKDRHPRTRLFACMCLIVIENTSSCYLQDIGIKTKLILILLELLDDSSPVGDEAPFALSSLISEKEDTQKLALEANAVDKLGKHLQVGVSRSKRIQGILLALADLCSKLECCRSRFLSLQVLDLVVDVLTHDSAEVRTAACVCLRSVSRSVKNLSAGHFMNEKIVIPLVQLLCDPCYSVQVAAVCAICNVVVDFTTHKSAFVRCGGVKRLVLLSKSMDPTLRINAAWALRNLMFLADSKSKEGIFRELTASLLSSLICDSEPLVQEQALALVRNLVDGCIDSIEYLFVEDGIILRAVGRQVQISSRVDVGIQGMYVFSNMAAGSEFHKDAVMHQILEQTGNSPQPVVLKFLQSENSQLRTATIWTVLNLICPTSPGAFCRIVKLRNAGIVSQIKTMVEDPCLDVKLRVRIVLGQSTTFGSGVQ